MNDLVERLRDAAADRQHLGTNSARFVESADRIERLEAIIDMALEVGKPDPTQTNAHTQALWRMRDTLRQSGAYGVAVPLPQHSGTEENR